METELTSPKFPATDKVDLKKVLIYWLPLAASWLLMALEWPFQNGAMARISEAERMIAAFGVVTAISLVVESPVMSLLSASTALSKGKQSFETLRKFTIQLMILTTGLHILIAWSPLFDWVVKDLMGIPENLLAPTQLGLKIMVLWSAAIAWRRFMQGILIRFGASKYVGIGTAVRLFSSALTATLFVLLNQLDILPLSGVVIASIGLEIGVISECIYIHWVTRKIIQENLSKPVENDQLKFQALLKFYWPLAASTYLFLLARPFVQTALAKTANPETTLAAWSILSSFLFLTRAPALALPAVVIALYDPDLKNRVLKKFCLIVGSLLVLLMGIFVFSPLSGLYFERVIGVSPLLSNMSTIGARYALILPLLTAILFYMRGMLTAQGNTFPITLGMVAELTILAAVLTIGVSLEIPGINLAAIALTLATAGDVGMLLLVNFIQKRKKDEL